MPLIAPPTLVALPLAYGPMTSMFPTAIVRFGPRKAVISLLAVSLSLADARTAENRAADAALKRTARREIPDADSML
jgi:hypothetical protein